MTSKRLGIIGGRTMRATVLDACGRPAYGDRAKIITKGFATVAVSANYDDGSEINEKNADGDPYLYRAAEPRLINLGINVTFVAVDPELFSAFTGQPVTYSAIDGKADGFGISDEVRPLDIGVALEVWSRLNDTVDCDDEFAAAVASGYSGWFWLSGGKIGDYSFEDGAVTFSVTDMVTRRGSLWGEGPYLVLPDSSGEPAGLGELVPGTLGFPKSWHQVLKRTTIAPPDVVVDGFTPLDDPTAPPAFSATAGNPGTFEPQPSRRPFALVDMTGVTSDPTAAWQAGQYVVLGDGSEATWTGTSWVAGRGGGVIRTNDPVGDSVGGDV